VSDIPGATSSTYTLVQADATFVITCQVTATNVAGSASVTSSNSLTIVDADAQAFITAANITDTTQQNAINTLVVDLKGYGVWTKMKAIYPFVGGTATSHSYNLKNTAQYQITWFGGVTHNANGITGNGTNGYGATGLPNNIMAQTSNHASIYSKSNIASQGIDIGASSGVNTTGIAIRSRTSTNFINLYNNNDSESTIPNTNSLGFFNNIRNNSTQIIGQKNNTLTTLSQNALNYSSVNFFLLRYGVFNLFFSPRNLAFSTIGDGLTSQEALDLYSAIQAFQTSLSRQV
jgi:hypothetical protein